MKAPGKSQVPYRGCCDLQFSRIYFDPNVWRFRCKRNLYNHTANASGRDPTSATPSPSRPENAKSQQAGADSITGKKFPSLGACRTSNSGMDHGQELPSGTYDKKLQFSNRYLIDTLLDTTAITMNK
jgi:hypothetical protein